MARITTVLVSLSISVGAVSVGTGLTMAQDASPEAQKPNTVSYDRSVWVDLLRANHTLLRTVTHTEDGIEAVTESTDPEIVAKLIDHAKAMKVRINTGAQVRIWDEVFVDLFENHAEITLDVTVTERGVKIKESSTDPKVVAIMRSHAMGVSDFVREGFESSGKQTRRFNDGDPIPAPELVVGGVAHHIVLIQPDADQLKALKAAGVDTVINLRKPSEHPDYDEAAAAAEAGLEYINHPYNGAGELTPELITAVRATLREQTEAGKRVAIHCRTGNRVAPVWMAYRVIDQGVSLDRAMAEAEAMHLTTPEYKVITLDYIATNWPDITP
ncbi:MAG: beta-lactamase hydrolase domain-containing protein [Phycisphaerales bacterium JB050]